MFKTLKLRKQLNDICRQRGYRLLGKIAPCKNRDDWDFAVQTQKRVYAVKMIPCYSKHCYAQLLSPKEVLVKKDIPVFGKWQVSKLTFASRNIAISTRESAFGIDLNSCGSEKFLLFFPAPFEVTSPSSTGTRILHAGCRIFGFAVADGALLKALLENDAEDISKYFTD